ncbi:N-acetylmuramoyl-L-alanine amidase [Clostridium oryzae]|uniref:N-acetylmuramoyl-L-alanine amidase LytC n=1 Tax=Clostridium oryzae TaxID=1450648 RepID=A0A1V4J0A3_9CLOT|nr:N-acetylmuramoyl-L-alanine amidase [Clostridium oryzae]OPJ65087.1 N-acetylmuramoyl-L-alanine amidase LytC precursor [Clostridium oryzae]
MRNLGRVLLVLFTLFTTLGFKSVEAKGIKCGTYLPTIKVMLVDSANGTTNRIGRSPRYKIKFAIDIGHNTPHDTGARGIRSEDELTREVGKRVIRKLRALGYAVVSTLPSTSKSQIDSFKQRVDIANKNKVDYFVSIHFNCGGGQGSEVFYYSSAGKRLAKNVVNQLAALGYRNRGVRCDKQHYVLKHTKAKAILIECAFVDSESDMARYNADRMAQAIVNGLIQA